LLVSRYDSQIVNAGASRSPQRGRRAIIYAGFMGEGGLPSVASAFVRVVPRLPISGHYWTELSDSAAIARVDSDRLFPIVCGIRFIRGALTP